MRATHRRNLRVDAARNVDRIVSGARRVFARARVDGAMEDVAGEAEVSVATVYRRFPSKDAPTTTDPGPAASISGRAAATSPRPATCSY